MKKPNKLDITVLPLSDLKGELLNVHLSFCHDEDEPVRPTWQFSTSRMSSAPTCSSGCWELLFHKVQEVLRSQFIFQRGRDFFLNTKNKLHKSYHLESVCYDACTGKKIIFMNSSVGKLNSYLRSPIIIFVLYLKILYLVTY